MWRRTSSVLTAQRGESGGVVDVELVGRGSAKRAIEERRRACRPRLGGLGRESQVLQHVPNDGGLVNERDKGEPPPTAGTGEHIQAQAPAHQLRPEVVATVAAVRPVRVFPDVIVGRSGGRAVRTPESDDEGPPRRPRGQDAVVEQQVDVWARRQRGEPLQQFNRLEGVEGLGLVIGGALELPIVWLAERVERPLHRMGYLQTWDSAGWDHDDNQSRHRG